MTSKQRWRVPKVCGATATAAGVMFGVAAETAPAAVSISIANVQVPAGSTTTALVSVYASSNSGDVISGFNLPLDYNDDGLVDANADGVGDLPAGFTLGTPLVRNAVYSNTGFDTPTPQITLINVDGIPTGSGGNVTLGTSLTKLFDLAITVAPTVPAGTVLPLEIVVPASPFDPLFNVAGPADPAVAAPTLTTPVFGSVTVVGVPEPTTLAAVAVAAGAAATRRRRRTR